MEVGETGTDGLDDNMCFCLVAFIDLFVDLVRR